MENSALHSIDQPPPEQHVDETIDTVMISEDDAAGSTDEEATGDVHGLADVGGSGQGIPRTPEVLPATPGAITPGAMTMVTMSPEIGVGPMHDISFGNALVEAPVAPTDLDSDPDDEIPLAALPIQRRLLQVLGSNTKWVPKYRLRCKMPSGQVQWTKVYRARKAKVNAKTLRYRVMYYCNTHCLAIRQRFGWKQQVGNSKMPAGMGVELGRGRAHKVRELLEADPTLEPNTSELLTMMLVE